MPTKTSLTFRYIPYAKAFRILKKRLNTTAEEMAAWVCMGAKNGGINAYLYEPELNTLPKFFFEPEMKEDYLSELMTCCFLEKDIELFEPKERFITGKILIKHWRAEFGKAAKSYIRSQIVESNLIDLHPTLGGTQGEDPSDKSLPSIEKALFSYKEVTNIEKENSFMGLFSDTLFTSSVKETSEERKKRIHIWYEQECHLGTRGAQTRVAAREGVSRQAISAILNRSE